MKKQAKERKSLSAIRITTSGLTLHSVADGLAMGSSMFLSFTSDSDSSTSSLGYIIFLAIILHKAPASVGFGTFLYHEGLRNWGVSFYLLWFTLSAPVTCILFYFGLIAWGSS
mmetsp:Transcript_36720/g.35480  ORF Transcript_36720/g.35480 Transcript_36720/m.35480 type:complete len:113 (-) Transcript_36720:279-617(-)